MAYSHSHCAQVYICADRSVLYGRFCPVTKSRVCLRWRRRLVDAVQLAATQHDENRGSDVICSSTYTWLIRQICQRSRNSPWFRYVDVDAHHTTSIQLLRSSTPNSQHHSYCRSLWYWCRHVEQSLHARRRCITYVGLSLSVANSFR